MNPNWKFLDFQIVVGMEVRTEAWLWASAAICGRSGGDLVQTDRIVYVEKHSQMLVHNAVASRKHVSVSGFMSVFKIPNTPSMR